MSGKHAFLPPSSAHIWSVCAMWPTMNDIYPETEPSVDSLEGDAGHWVASEAVIHRTLHSNIKAPNGVMVTQEMIEGAKLYATDIINTCGENQIHVEQPIKCPSIHAKNEGTPDAWAFIDSHVLYIWDYKFGREFIEVFENRQLINYVSGILDFLEVDGLADQYIRVVMRIVQPRSYHRDGPIREWSIMASDLRGHFNKLANSADLAMAKSPKAVPGPHCRNCPGRHACVPNQAAAFVGCELSIGGAPLELPPNALGRELKTLRYYRSILDARISGLEVMALNAIKSGEQVPHFKTEYSAGRTIWSKPLEEVITMGRMMGVDVSRPDAMTPKQAIKAGLPAEVVNAFSETGTGSLKLIEDDGKTARKVFG